MKRFATALLGSFVLALSALAIPAVAVASPAGSVDSSNRIIFTTGPLTGVFEGNVPHIAFYATNGLGRTTYQLNFRSLTEFSLSSGSEVYGSPEFVARADFDSAAWAAGSFYPLKDSPTGPTVGMGFNFTLKGPMKIVDPTGQTVSQLGTGTVVLVVKAYNSTRSMTINQQTVNISTAEIKIDFVLTGWPFVHAGDKIALQVNMHSDYNHFDLDQNNGTTNVDATQDEGASVTEHPYQETPNAEQEVRYSSGPITSSMNIGFFHFVNHATITNSTGTYSVPVVASYKAEKDGLETFFKLYLAYPYFTPGSTLTHDPSFGLGSGLPTLYIIAGGAGIAALAAVVVIRRRHTQVQKDSGQN